jgi:2-C-methyl-D-erythritol 4-phosphate cytidylyltransferase
VVPWPALRDTPFEGHAASVLAEADLGARPGAGLVLVDERCPGLTAEDVRRVLASAPADAVAVGVRPVTDTVKRLQDGYVGPTVDRDGLVAVCSPVVVPAALARSVGSDPDLPALVSRLAASGVPVVHVEVPVAARRLGDVAELVLL